MQTFDRATVDSAGAFLVGELERLDQTLHMPLASVTWGRDIDLREDVTIAEEFSSFTNSSFGAVGGANPAGKAWIGKTATDIAGMQLDIGKTVQPLTLWGMELSYTIPELMSAQQLGRPVDSQKFEGMNFKHQMDIDEMVYIGDTTLGYTGLVNATSVTAANVANGAGGSPLWVNKTADEILADFNTLLSAAWSASGFAVTPSKVLVAPAKFGYLATRKVSDAGNISILEYLKQNTIANSNNGKPLEIVPVKWLTGRGAGGTDRMVAYTQDRTRVRYPLVPLQRTPLEYRGIYHITTYFGRLGSTEIVYPETIRYADGF